MVVKEKRWMTLDEHDSQLKAEGRYEAVQELHRQLEEERQKKAAEWRKAEKPLMEELNEAGFAVTSAWDLVNTKARYPAAVPILLKHLMRPYPERVREGIARALAVPEARMGWETLLQAFRDETDTTTSGVKWALALALGAAATDEVLGDVLPLVRDLDLGRNRVPLLPALGRSNDARARQLLEELQNDETIAREVKKILSKRGSKSRISMSSLAD